MICFCNIHTFLHSLSHPKKPPNDPTHLPAPLPKVENITLSHVTPYGFRVSWEVKQQLQQEDLAPSSGRFRYFHVVVTDSGWLLEPQEFSVPGNQTHLDVTGLITGIGYEVRLTGVSESGLLSRPLTTVAVTGTSQRTPPPLAESHTSLTGCTIFGSNSVISF